MKVHGSAVWRLLHKIRKRSAPQIHTPSWKIRARIRAKCQNLHQRPHPKSAPKIRTKIRTQNPHQNPHPNAQPIPTEPCNEKATRGVPQAAPFCISLRFPNKKLTPKSVTRLRGSPVATFLWLCSCEMSSQLKKALRQKLRQVMTKSETSLSVN